MLIYNDDCTLCHLDKVELTDFAFGLWIMTEISDPLTGRGEQLQ